MKRLLYIILILGGSLACSAQSGTGWIPSRVKQNVLDSIYFNRDARFNSTVRINENALRIGLVTMTANGNELNILDGALVNTNELNNLVGVTGKTGTGNLVLNNSPTLLTPNLGTPSAVVLTNATGTASGLTVGGVSWIRRQAMSFFSIYNLEDEPMDVQNYYGGTGFYIYPGTGTYLRNYLDTTYLGTGTVKFLNGNLGYTTGRLGKGWLTDLDVINLPTVNGGTFKTALSLAAADVGLGNVTNESKATMFTSPTFTGTVQLPTTTELNGTRIDSALVPYTGASTDLDLGDKNFYTSGNIGSSSDNITHGYFDDITVTNPLRAKIRSDSIIWGDGDIVSIAATNLKDLEILGSSVKAMTLGVGVGETKAQVVMVDNSLKFIPVYVRVPAIITGVKLGIHTQGDYTSDNYNGVGLYKYNTTLDSLELVASSTDDGDIWKASSGTMITKAFSATYNADDGLYYVGCLWNASATTVAPQVYGTSPGIWVGGLLSSGYFIAGAEAGQATLPAIYKASDINTSSTSYFVFLY